MRHARSGIAGMGMALWLAACSSGSPNAVPATDAAVTQDTGAQPDVPGDTGSTLDVALDVPAPQDTGEDAGTPDVAADTGAIPTDVAADTGTDVPTDTGAMMDATLDVPMDTGADTSVADVPVARDAAPDVVPDVVPVDAGPPPCHADTDCAGSALGSVCDTPSGRCVQCSAAHAATCGAGTYCTATGTCASGCSVDADCAGVPSATVACVSHGCVTTCVTGRGDCDGNPANGCETDLTSTPTRCGACGTMCAVPTGAHATCTAGVCGFTCLAGSADCDGNPANGCETDITATAAHCGACATACAPGATCVASACVTPRSCTDVQTNLTSAASGAYTVDPDGAGPGAPLPLYCDMTTDGGGWMLIHKTDQSNSNDRTDTGYNVGALATPDLNAVGVLPRATIAALAGGVTRVQNSDRTRTFYVRGFDYYTTDAHTGTAQRDVEATVDLSRGMAPGQVVFNPSHGPCFMAGPWPDPSTTVQHICTQRWCCGAPNAGIWWNYGPWSPGSYTSGSAWVRACAAGHADCNLTVSDGCEVNLATDAGNCGACGRACAPGVACMAGACRLPRTCAELLAAAPATPSGAYTLDPDGTGPVAPLRLYCDMTTDGGGWTLVHKTDQSSSSDRTDTGFQTAFLASPALNTVAVLPRSVIAMMGATTRVLNTDGTRRFYFRGISYYTTDAHASTAMAAVEATVNLAAGFMAGNAVFNASHGVCVTAGPWPDATGTVQHICSQRWCCGGPNAGIWWNYGPWSPGSYTGGTAWVR